jgi:superfamily II DNA/RNA helicase
MRLSRTEGVRDSITDDRLCLWIPDLPRNRVHHGKLGSADRRQAQDTFMRGEVRVMVATNAFGMGIDKTDIRFARRSRQLLPGVGRRGPRWRAGRLHPAFSPGARNKVHTAVALMRQLGSCARAPRVVSQSCVRVSRQKRFAPCSTHTATGANWIRPRSRAWCSTRRQACVDGRSCWRTCRARPRRRVARPATTADASPFTRRRRRKPRPHRWTPCARRRDSNRRRRCKSGDMALEGAG